MIIACKEHSNHLNKIEGRRIEINDSIVANLDIEAFIKPYKTHIEKDLDSVIGFAVDTYSKSDGELNTALGNFMADAIYEQANLVFNKRTGHNADLALLNHGGIRSIISKGPIKIRNIYERDILDSFF